MKDFNFFIYDEVQITPNTFSLVLSNTHVICAIINKITHRANRIQCGIANSFISFDEAVLHVISQSDFLSGDLQNFIYLMSLMTLICELTRIFVKDLFRIDFFLLH